MDFKSKVREIENEIHRQMNFIDKRELKDLNYGQTLQYLRRELKDKSTSKEEQIMFRTLTMETAIRLTNV